MTEPGHELVGQRVALTGSSGGLGRAVVEDLQAAGCTVIGFDRTESASSQPDEFFLWDGVEHDTFAEQLQGCTGLIHLAAIPSPYNHPDQVVFSNNTQATYVALSAAAQAGITSSVIASSCSAYGLAWSKEPSHPLYVPVDEDHPMLIADPYGLSKQVDERTAEMFVRRDGSSIVALRFHWIASTEEQLRRLAADNAILDADRNWDHECRDVWGYVDRHDAARACRLALVAAADPELGLVAVNIVADDSLTDRPVGELIAEHAPHIEIRADLGPTGGAWSNRRAAEVIGWRPERTWRDA